MGRLLTLCRKLLIVCLLGGSMVGAGITTATVFSGSAEAYPRLVRIWCKKDFKKYCKRYKVGTSRMRRCMQSYAPHLSPVCKKALIDSGLARRYGY